MGSVFDWPQFRSCRICHRTAPETDLLKYSVRHYAHPNCLFSRYGCSTFGMIPLHALRNLNRVTVKRWGLTKEWAGAIEIAEKAERVQR